MESMARERSQVTYHIVPDVLQRLRFSHRPWTPRSFLLLCFERRHGHTDVGNSVQVDTNSGRPELGPASISIEI